MAKGIYTGTRDTVTDVEAFFYHLIVKRKMYDFHPNDGFMVCKKSDTAPTLSVPTSFTQNWENKERIKNA